MCLLLFSFGLLACFVQATHCFWHHRSVVQCTGSSMLSPAVLLLFGISQAIYGFVFLYEFQEIFFCSFVKNIFGILVESALNLYLAFGNIVIFLIIFVNQAMWKLILSSNIFLIFFLQNLEVFLIEVFDFLGQIYVQIILDYFAWHIFLDLFLSKIVIDVQQTNIFSFVGFVFGKYTVIVSQIKRSSDRAHRII